MNPISFNQLKTRIGLTVGFIVIAVLCISALGLIPELSGRPGSARLPEGIPLQQLVLTLLLCLLLTLLTRILFRHLDDLKQTQEVIEGQQAQLAIKAAQIDAANDVILQVNEEGRLVHFNQALCRLTGYSADELAGTDLHLIEPPEYAARIEPNITRLMECGEATFESAYLSKGGELIPIEVHAHLTRSEGHPLILSIVRDITHRRRSDEKEKRRLETLERIARDGSLDELLTCVALYVEQEIPEGLCSLLLVDDSGRRLRHGASPSLPEEYNRAVDGLRIGTVKGAYGTPAFLRERVVVEDLQSHPFWHDFQPAREAGLKSCWSEPVFASTGTLLGCITVYHREPCLPGEEEIQVIESAAHLAGMAIGRVRADEGRRVLEEQLRHSQKIEAVGQLAAGVAHDFNNLLTPIIVYGDMLLRFTPEGSPQARMVSAMTQAAQKASDLTQKLLSFGRKQVLHMDLLDLNDVIVSFRDIMRATVRDNITIDLRLSPGGAKVQADRGQLEQVLLNLLLNSQDAMEGGGSVCIETGHLILDEEFHRQHPVAKPGHHILLAISDDGCGMAEDTLKHMYEPFFTTKEVGRGTGLGLAAVYGIVKRHGGCIDVKSRPGEGTTFSIYLPASSSTAEPIAAIPLRSARKNDQGEGKTILLVVDNAMIRGVTGELLTSSGYRVLAAETPARAIELAGEERIIHLLATDMVLPEMTGPELYQRLLEEHPVLPVLYISGYTSQLAPQDETQPQEAIFLAKPFTMEQFMARIDELLGTTSFEGHMRPLDHKAMARLLANEQTTPDTPLTAERGASQ